jgi:NifB/MoaA-like Fe-S oxidoreductase
VREPTVLECRRAVEEVERWQECAGRERGAPWVFGADELYLRADLPLPPAALYGDFEQVENGVGSVRFLQGRIEADADLFREWEGQRIGVVTGTSMGRLMPEVLDPLASVSGAVFELISVENGLFGPRVTTAGLLPGASIRAALEGRQALDFVLLPGESVNDDGLFIDSMSADSLAACVPMPVRFSKDFSDAISLGAAA